MRLAALLLAATLLTPQQPAAPPPPSRPFEPWLQELIAEARARGFSDEIIDATLSGITPIQRVVERDSSQAEFTITLDRYFETRVTPRVIRLGREQAMEQRALLRRIRMEYGVSPGVVLASTNNDLNFNYFPGGQIAGFNESLSAARADRRDGSLGNRALPARNTSAASVSRPLAMSTPARLK